MSKVDITAKDGAVGKMIDKLKDEKLIQLDKDGVGTLDKESVEKLLPEGTTLKDIEKADEVKRNIASAVAIVFGSENKKLFEKNKDLERAELVTHIGKHTKLTVIQSRNKTIRNVADGTVKEVEGYVSSRMVTVPSVRSSQINELVQKGWGKLSS